MHASSTAFAAASRRRAYWLKKLHTWHWVSSAVCLIGMLLFTLTGITLNHAGEIEATPEVRRVAATLPPPLRAQLAQMHQMQGQQPHTHTVVPPALAHWVRAQWALELKDPQIEWAEGEIYLALPRPGGDAWLRADWLTGQAEYERTDRGIVAYLNDLHKGRHTGVVWRWFIDALALACLVFTVSGLLLLQLHATKRRSTWPVVGLGLVVPMLLVLWIKH